MNIGDRVRLLHGKEEGRVIKINKNVVDVEIDEGFVIPVLKNELVLISKEESDFFTDSKKETGTKTSTTTVSAKSDFQEGLYLAYIPFNDKECKMYLVNHTAYDVLFALFEQQGDNANGLASGTVSHHSEKLIGTQNLQQFNDWSDLNAQALFYKEAFHTVKSPVTTLVKFKASTFFRSKRMVPYVNEEGYIIRVNFEHKKVNPSELKEKMFQATEPEPSYSHQSKGQNIELDLHMESLFPDGHHLKENEIMGYQLGVFEKALDEAVIKNADSIKFIHGIGNGKLRHEIHKRLSQYQGIKFFEDSDKGKFGYGATLVQIR